MLDKGISYLIVQSIKEILEESSFSEKNLQIGLWSGYIVLENLVLKRKLFDDENVPVSLTYGFIGRLELRLPFLTWNLSYMDPLVINIDKVFLLVSPKYNWEKSESASVRENAIKQARLAAANMIGDHYDDHSPIGNGYSKKILTYFGEKILSSAINNFQLTVTNVHVRYEDRVSFPTEFCFGITLDSFSISTNQAEGTDGVAESNSSASSSILSNLWSINTGSKVSKTVKLEKFAIYWNPLRSPSDRSVHSLVGYSSMDLCSTVFSDREYSEMEYLMCHTIPTCDRYFGECNGLKHHYIQSPLSATTTADITLGPSLSSIQISLTTQVEEIVLCLEDQQVKEILGLTENVQNFMDRNKFSKYRPMASCRDDPASWWRFAISAVRLLLGHCDTSPLTWTALHARRDDRLVYTELWKRYIFALPRNKGQYNYTNTVIDRSRNPFVSHLSARDVDAINTQMLSISQKRKRFSKNFDAIASGVFDSYEELYDIYVDGYGDAGLDEASLVYTKLSATQTAFLVYLEEKLTFEDIYLYRCVAELEFKREESLLAVSVPDNSNSWIPQAFHFHWSDWQNMLLTEDMEVMSAAKDDVAGPEDKDRFVLLQEDKISVLSVLEKIYTSSKDSQTHSQSGKEKGLKKNAASKIEHSIELVSNLQIGRIMLVASLSECCERSISCSSSTPSLRRNSTSQMSLSYNVPSPSLPFLAVELSKYKWNAAVNANDSGAKPMVKVNSSLWDFQVVEIVSVAAGGYVDGSYRLSNCHYRKIVCRVEDRDTLSGEDQRFGDYFDEDESSHFTPWLTANFATSDLGASVGAKANSIASVAVTVDSLALHVAITPQQWITSATIFAASCTPKTDLSKTTKTRYEDQESPRVSFVKIKKSVDDSLLQLSKFTSLVSIEATLKPTILVVSAENQPIMAPGNAGKMASSSAECVVFDVGTTVVKAGMHMDGTVTGSMRNYSGNRRSSFHLIDVSSSNASMYFTKKSSCRQVLSPVISSYNMSLTLQTGCKYYGSHNSSQRFDSVVTIGISDVILTISESKLFTLMESVNSIIRCFQEYELFERELNVPPVDFATNCQLQLPPVNPNTTPDVFYEKLQTNNMENSYAAFGPGTSGSSTMSRSSSSTSLSAYETCSEGEYMSFEECDGVEGANDKGEDKHKGGDDAYLDKLNADAQQLLQELGRLDEIRSKLLLDSRILSEKQVVSKSERNSVTRGIKNVEEQMVSLRSEYVDKMIAINSTKRSWPVSVNTEYSAKVSVFLDTLGTAKTSGASSRVIGDVTNQAKIFHSRVNTNSICRKKSKTSVRTRYSTNALSCDKDSVLLTFTMNIRSIGFDLYCNKRYVTDRNSFGLDACDAPNYMLDTDSEILLAKMRVNNMSMSSRLRAQGAEVKLVIIDHYLQDCFHENGKLFAFQVSSKRPSAKADTTFPKWDMLGRSDDSTCDHLLEITYTTTYLIEAEDSDGVITCSQCLVQHNVVGRGGFLQVTLLQDLGVHLAALVTRLSIANNRFMASNTAVYPLRSVQINEKSPPRSHYDEGVCAPCSPSAAADRVSHVLSSSFVSRGCKLCIWLDKSTSYAMDIIVEGVRVECALPSNSCPDMTFEVSNLFVYEVLPSRVTTLVSKDSSSLAALVLVRVRSNIVKGSNKIFTVSSTYAKLSLHVYLSTVDYFLKGFQKSILLDFIIAMQAIASSNQAHNSGTRRVPAPENIRAETTQSIVNPLEALQSLITTSEGSFSVDGNGLSLVFYPYSQDATSTSTDISSEYIEEHSIKTQIAYGLESFSSSVYWGASSKSGAIDSCVKLEGLSIAVVDPLVHLIEPFDVSILMIATLPTSDSLYSSSRQSVAFEGDTRGRAYRNSTPQPFVDIAANAIAVSVGISTVHLHITDHALNILSYCIGTQECVVNSISDSVNIITNRLNTIVPTNRLQANAIPSASSNISTDIQYAINVTILTRLHELKYTFSRTILSNEGIVGSASFENGVFCDAESDFSHTLIFDSVVSMSVIELTNESQYQCQCRTVQEGRSCHSERNGPDTPSSKKCLISFMSCTEIKRFYFRPGASVSTIWKSSFVNILESSAEERVDKLASGRKEGVTFRSVISFSQERALAICTDVFDIQHVHNSFLVAALAVQLKKYKELVVTSYRRGKGSSPPNKVSYVISAGEGIKPLAVRELSARRNYGSPSPDPMREGSDGGSASNILPIKRYILQPSAFFLPQVLSEFSISLTIHSCILVFSSSKSEPKLSPDSEGHAEVRMEFYSRLSSSYHRPEISSICDVVKCELSNEDSGGGDDMLNDIFWTTSVDVQNEIYLVVSQYDHSNSIYYKKVNILRPMSISLLHSLGLDVVTNGDHFEDKVVSIVQNINVSVSKVELLVSLNYLPFVSICGTCLQPLIDLMTEMELSKSSSKYQEGVKEPVVDDILDDRRGASKEKHPISICTLTSIFDVLMAFPDLVTQSSLCCSVAIGEVLIVDDIMVAPCPLIKLQTPQLQVYATFIKELVNFSTKSNSDVRQTAHDVSNLLGDVSLSPSPSGGANEFEIDSVPIPTHLYSAKAFELKLVCADTSCMFYDVSSYRWVQMLEPTSCNVDVEFTVHPSWLPLVLIQSHILQRHTRVNDTRVKVDMSSDVIFEDNFILRLNSSTPEVLQLSMHLDDISITMRPAVFNAVNRVVRCLNKVFEKEASSGFKSFIAAPLIVKPEDIAAATIVNNTGMLLQYSVTCSYSGQSRTVTLESDQTLPLIPSFTADFVSPRLSLHLLPPSAESSSFSSSGPILLVRDVNLRKDFCAQCLIKDYGNNAESSLEYSDTKDSTSSSSSEMRIAIEYLPTTCGYKTFIVRSTIEVVNSLSQRLLLVILRDAVAMTSASTISAAHTWRNVVGQNARICIPEYLCRQKQYPVAIYIKPITDREKEDILLAADQYYDLDTFSQIYVPNIPCKFRSSEPSSDSIVRHSQSNVLSSRKVSAAHSDNKWDFKTVQSKAMSYNCYLELPSGAALSQSKNVSYIHAAVECVGAVGRDELSKVCVTGKFLSRVISLSSPMQITNLLSCSLGVLIVVAESSSRVGRRVTENTLSKHRVQLLMLHRGQMGEVTAVHGGEDAYVAAKLMYGPIAESDLKVLSGWSDLVRIPGSELESVKDDTICSVASIVSSSGATLSVNIDIKVSRGGLRDISLSVPYWIVTKASSDLYYQHYPRNFDGELIGLNGVDDDLAADQSEAVLNGHPFESNVKFRSSVSNSWSEVGGSGVPSFLGENLLLDHSDYEKTLSETWKNKPYKLMHCGYSHQEESICRIRLRIEEFPWCRSPISLDSNSVTVVSAMHSSKFVVASGANSSSENVLNNPFGVPVVNDQMQFFAVTSTRLPSPFHRTRLVTVVDRFVILNHLDYPVKLREVGFSGIVDVPVQTEFPLSWNVANVKQIFQIRISATGWLWSGSIYTQKLEDGVSLVLRRANDDCLSFADVSIVHQGPKLCIILKPSSCLIPYRIENKTPNAIRLRQSNVSFCTTLNPLCACSFLWDEPFQAHKLVVERQLKVTADGDNWAFLGEFFLDDVDGTKSWQCGPVEVRLSVFGSTRLLAIIDKRAALSPRGVYSSHTNTETEVLSKLSIISSPCGDGSDRRDRRDASRSSPQRRFLIKSKLNLTAFKFNILSIDGRESIVRFETSSVSTTVSHTPSGVGDGGKVALSEVNFQVQDVTLIGKKCHLVKTTAMENFMHGIIKLNNSANNFISFPLIEIGLVSHEINLDESMLNSLLLNYGNIVVHPLHRSKSQYDVCRLIYGDKEEALIFDAVDKYICSMLLLAVAPVSVGPSSPPTVVLIETLRVQGAEIVVSLDLEFIGAERSSGSVAKKAIPAVIDNLVHISKNAARFLTYTAAQSGCLTFPMTALDMSNIHGEAPQVINRIILEAMRNTGKHYVQRVTSPASILRGLAEVSKYTFAYSASFVGNFAIYSQSLLEHIMVDQENSQPMPHSHDTVISKSETKSVGVGCGRPSSFVDGMSQGFRGMWRDPFVGLKSNGLKGFMQGTVRGIVGAVTKPTFGVLEDVSHQMQLVAKALTSRSTMSRNLIEYSSDDISNTAIFKEYVDTRESGSALLVAYHYAFELYSAHDVSKRILYCAYSSVVKATCRSDADVTDAATALTPQLLDIVSECPVSATSLTSKAHRKGDARYQCTASLVFFNSDKGISEHIVIIFKGKESLLLFLDIVSPHISTLHNL